MYPTCINFESTLSPNLNIAACLSRKFTQTSRFPEPSHIDIAFTIKIDLVPTVIQNQLNYFFTLLFYLLMPSNCNSSDIILYITVFVFL